MGVSFAAGLGLDATSVARSADAASTSEGRLSVVKTFDVPQGFACWSAWSDDGKTLYLANSESDRMSVVRIDATKPSAPSITGKFNDGATYRAWAIAQRKGALVVMSSYGTWLTALHPDSFTPKWEIDLGTGTHALATNGTEVYVPLESHPGKVLVVNAATGRTVGTFITPEDWSANGHGHTIYGAAVHPTRPFFAVSVYGTEKTYLLDVSKPSSPTLKGTLPVSSGGNIAMAGTRLWLDSPLGGIQCWNIADRGSPSLVGTFHNTPYDDPGAGGKVVRAYGQMRANAAGTRLYAVYQTSSLPGARGHDEGKDAGLEIFNIAEGTPVSITSAGWRLSIGDDAVPTGLDLSPDGAIVAVTYQDFGVRFHSVTHDTITPLSTIPTSGESRDVYVDAAGYVYSFADYLIIPYSPSGQQLPNAFFDSNYHDGQWIPFKDGLIITPSGFTGNRGIVTWRLARGVIQRASFFWDNEAAWALAFDGTHLYQGGDTGLVVYAVGGAPDYPLKQIGTLPNIGALRAIALHGPVVWVTGPQVGVAAIDVTNPTAPAQLYRDAFSYATNGDHAAVVVARNRVYAGCGSKSVRIYDPVRRTATGTIPGYFVTFLDKVREDLLVVSHYGDGIQVFRNEGVYVYDLRRDPDAPTQFAHWPATNSGNFRSRVANGMIYRCPLWGIEELAIHGYP